ncbi:ester cyclase [Pendulispora rubella]|uniref:Ester cyclase n=1 Tax=Pendulispora rubella TaxID=2741070 RepID=A0ABZ2L5C8_9BACT
MNIESARAFYQEYLDTVYQQRRLGELDRFFSEDLVVHPPFPGELNLSGVKTAAKMLLDTLSDCHIVPSTFVYADGILASRIVCTGTHTGSYMGIPPTGQKLQIIAHPHYRLQNGKFVEMWDCTDMVDLGMQIAKAHFPRATFALKRLRDGWTRLRA